MVSHPPSHAAFLAVQPSLAPLHSPSGSSSFVSSSAESSYLPATRSSSASSVKSAHGTGEHTRTLRFLPSLAHSSALVLEDVHSGEELYTVYAGRGPGWSRELWRECALSGGRSECAGAVDELALGWRGRQVTFKQLYKHKFYTRAVKFAGPDGRTYKWERQSSWKGDDLVLLNGKRTVATLARPTHHPHELVLAEQVAPWAEWIVLAALQRAWALGLDGPEEGFERGQDGGEDEDAQAW